MYSILLSIQPEWVNLILQGVKTFEVRKTRPKLKTPFKCYIYCTKSKDKITVTTDKLKSGMVVGEFTCDYIMQLNCDINFNEYFVAGYVGAYLPLKEMCLNQEQLMDYGHGNKLYAWHISNLIVYNIAKQIETFTYPCLNKEVCEECKYSVNKGLPWVGGKLSIACDRNIHKAPQSYCIVENK